MPSVSEALQRLNRELLILRQQKHTMMKIVHGYGSTGKGGDIRIAVQSCLKKLAEEQQIRTCIFGEEWSKSYLDTWRLVQAHPELKADPDLGRRNLGITIVVL